MTDTITALALAAIDAHEQARSEYSPELSQLYSELAARFPVIRREEVERRGLRDAFTSGRRFLYLPPLKDQELWLPIASVYLPAEAAISYQVAFFAGTGVYDHAFGVRFESPEGSAAGTGFGVHNYYHAQLCRDLRPHHDRATLIDWLPVTQPAFPLDAVDDESLLAAMLIALYGASFLTEITRALGELPASVKDMRLVQMQPVYWRVSLPGKRVIYVRGRQAYEPKIISRVKIQFGTRRIESVTATSYLESDLADRWVWSESQGVLLLEPPVS
jgi:hypothetical protein